MAYLINVQTNLANAVQTIAGMIGQPAPPDPAGSTDPSTQQMVTACNQAASDLYAMRDWQELRQQLTLTIVGDVASQSEKSFNLPSDYGRFVDATQWSAQQQWPAIGPISPQVWMQYLVNNLEPVTTFYWQVRNDKLFILRPPYPTGQSFQAYYISRGYVQDADDSALLKNNATKNGDIFLLDGQLIILLGRVKWLEYKGFDTSAAMRDFQLQYDSRAGSDEGAPIYNLSSRAGMPLLSVLNLPNTGYGS